MADRRIRLFEKFREKQLEQLRSLPHDPIKITLSDGSVKAGKRWEVTPMDIAVQISKNFAFSALISSVNHVLWDMTRPLEGDCSLEIFGFDSDQGRDTLWHSSAHILGQALEQEFGGKLYNGPCTTRDEHFYYDAFYDDLGLDETHFPNIEAGAAKASQEGQPFERIEVTKVEALELFSDNSFKVEIINDTPEDKTITVYRCGPLLDLCPGPHIPNTSFVKAFKCLKVTSSAYWRDGRYRESLQRVYGISYPDYEQLKDYLKSIEEARESDLIQLGEQQTLIFRNPYSPRDWGFTEHGQPIYNKLMNFFKNASRKMGYEESGQQKFVLGPISCPAHCLMFKQRVHSYKELPIRMADFGALQLNEASGAFLQDDGHIFCTEDQVREEVKGALDLVDYVCTRLGFTYKLKLSKFQRPENYDGDLETWDRAEEACKNAIKDCEKPLLLNERDGEFYGPEIDITIIDAMKRIFRCATLKLDSVLPARLGLKYTTNKGKRETPVIIHRSVLGSIKDIFGKLLEQNQGKWPFWLSPRQAIVCSASNEYRSYAIKVRDQIHEAGYSVDVNITDHRNSTDKWIGKKVRKALIEQYNYILVVGDKEATTGQVSVRLRDEDGSHIRLMSVEKLVNELKHKTDNFL